MAGWGHEIRERRGREGEGERDRAKRLTLETRGEGEMEKIGDRVSVKKRGREKQTGGDGK